MSPAKKVPIIISVVCNEYRIAVKDLIKPNPTKQANPFFEPKFLAMYLVRTHTTYTMLQIGQMFGYTKAGSTNHALAWVDDKADTDDIFKNRLSKIEAILPQAYKQSTIV